MARGAEDLAVTEADKATEQKRGKCHANMSAMADAVSPGGPHLELACAAASVMAIDTVFRRAATLSAVITLLREGIASLVVQVTVPAEPAGRIIFVNQAIAIVVDSWIGMSRRK